jgi:stage III sporulation protein AG
VREGFEKLLRQGKNWFSLPALAVLTVGCLLLLIPTGAKADTQREEKTKEPFDLERFEGRLEEALSRIEGAGETKVVLSLDSGERQVLAQDREQTNSGASVQTVTVGGGSERSVVPVQTMAPEFRGALVVSPGAGDAAVRLALTRAVSVLTGLGSDCICVTTGMT